MKRWMQKMLAMALALMMMCAPLLAYATDEVPVDVEDTEFAQLDDEYAQAPGGMLSERLGAAFYEGHEIKLTVKAQDFAMPEMMMDAPDAREIAEMMTALLQAMRVDVSVVLHEEQAIAKFDVRIQDISVLRVAARVAADGVSIETSALPKKTLFIRTALPAMAMQQFSGGNLYFSGLDDNPDAQAVFEAIYAYFEDQVAGWVSKWQIERGDLYTYDTEGEPATDTRDEAYVIMDSRIRPVDLKTLIRGLADKFYADDLLQQNVTNLLSGFGVTREMVRAFADQLPLDIAALEATDKPTEFTWAQDDMSGTVGFNGTMPAFFTRFPFKEGYLDYDRKTLDDGRHGHAVGEMEYPDGKLLQGDLTTFQGKPEDGKTVIGNDLTLTLVDEAGEQVFEAVSSTKGTITRTEDSEALDITAEQTRKMQVIDIDALSKATEKVAAETALPVAEQSAAPQETAAEKLPMKEATQHTESHVAGSVRAVGDLDFEAEYTVEASVDGVRTGSVRYTAASGEYKPGKEFTGEVIDILALSPQEQELLFSDLKMGMEQAGLRAMAAMPPSVWGTFKKIIQGQMWNMSPRLPLGPGPAMMPEPTAAPAPAVTAAPAL